MKRPSLFIVLLALFAGFLSCEKDDDEPRITNPHGLWIGTYTVTQLPSAGSMYYSFIIKPDGKVLTEGVGANGSTYYSQGTWAITGDSLKLNYTTINFPGPQVTQSAAFYFNANERILTGGTWKDGANGSNYTGTFPTMVLVD